MLAGRYELRTVLGRGGTAQVWSAVDRRLGRTVAVKILDLGDAQDRSALARFDREARTAAMLTHPNIVAVHDVGAETGPPFIVMELVAGRSLAERLADGPLDVGAAVDIAMQVCDALAAAHDAGVVHRDVKPANILFTEDGRAKVCDFGIARLLGTGQVDLTASAQAIGTSTYMAPEQLTGEPVDARTDLYALGCVLHTMLTGQPPFTGDSPIQIAMQHLHQNPPAVSDRRPGVPPALDHLVAALLGKRPADRPAGAAEVRSALAGLDRRSVPLTTVMPAAGAQPFRASAPVARPTQVVPVIDSAGPAGSGLRIGLGGATLIALAAAAVTAIVVAAVLAFRSDDPADQTAAPQTGTTATAPATPGTVTPPATTVTDPLPALTAAIDAERRAGRIEADTARDFTKRVNEIARDIGKDDTDKAAEKTAELRRKLTEARDDGKIDTAAYTAVVTAVDRLAATLPIPDKRD
jgi:serine/threonine-protein kinase